MAGVRLSIGEKLDLVRRFLFVCKSHSSSSIARSRHTHTSSVPFTAITYILSTFPRARRTKAFASRKHFFQNVFFRVALIALAPRQLQTILPSTAKQYDMWLAEKRRKLESSSDASSAVIKKHLQPRADRLPNDDEGQVLWLGNPDTASKFVLLLHGGGFIVPINPGHLDWCYQAYFLPYATAGVGGTPDVAVAVLQYTLTPGASYPTQLRQSCQALAIILDKYLAPRNISPSKSLLIGGDSAGGNLAALVVRHLIQPHPGIDPVKLPQGEALAGVFLTSPFVDTNVDTRSFKDNNSFDMISDALINMAVDMMIRDRSDLPDLTVHEIKALAAPLQGDMSSWLGQVDSVVKSLYVTVGGQEVFKDQVVGFVDKLKKHCPAVELRFEYMEREVHDYILIEGGSQQFGDATQRMKNWTAEALGL